MNFLEELVSEWYRFRQYYVNENVRVAPRPRGGFDGELDIVAFQPVTGEVVHIETSMDADSWDERRRKFELKFRKGRQAIPGLLPFADITKLRQEAVFGYPRSTRDKKLLGPGVRVYLMPEFMDQIRTELAKRRVESGAVPEIYPLLRAIQFALDFGGFLDR